MTIVRIAPHLLDLSSTCFLVISNVGRDTSGRGWAASHLLVFHMISRGRNGGEGGRRVPPFSDQHGRSEGESGRRVLFISTCLPFLVRLQAEISSTRAVEEGATTFSPHFAYFLAYFFASPFPPTFSTSSLLHLRTSLKIFGFQNLEPAGTPKVLTLLRSSRAVVDLFRTFLPLRSHLFPPSFLPASSHLPQTSPVATSQTCRSAAKSRCVALFVSVTNLLAFNPLSISSFSSCSRRSKRTHCEREKVTRPSFPPAQIRFPVSYTRTPKPESNHQRQANLTRLRSHHQCLLPAVLGHFSAVTRQIEERQ